MMLVWKGQTLRLLLLMGATWLLLSGLFKTQLLILGLLSVILVTWLAHRMRILNHRGQPLYFSPFRLLAYWGWLLREIFSSNVSVTRTVLSRDMAIEPAIGKVSATPDSELGDVIYANSITLTPGTTAISFTPDGHVLVHALHADALKELDQRTMASRVAKVEPDMVGRASDGSVLPGRSR